MESELTGKYVVQRKGHKCQLTSGKQLRRTWLIS